MGNGQVCYGNIVQRLNELNVEVGGRWRGQLSSAISLFSMSTAIDCCLSADTSLASRGNLSSVGGGLQTPLTPSDP